jgi:hypothetical protein
MERTRLSRVHFMCRATTPATSRVLVTVRSCVQLTCMNGTAVLRRGPDLAADDVKHCGHWLQ